jgi:hypothetical protein
MATTNNSISQNNYQNNKAINFKHVHLELKQKYLHKKTMRGIIRSTHCVGCDIKFNVCFFGYCRQYCCKSCWRYIFMEFGDDEGDYEYEPCYSKANTNYHSKYYSERSKNGFYWPMCRIDRLCNNQCIKTKSTSVIPGYNKF